MGVQEHHLSLPAVIDNVEAACEFVSSIARANGLGEDAVYHCYLAVEEICTNIIEHGYNFDGGNAIIDVVCRVYPDKLTISILDDAEPFNPLRLAEPDPSAPLIERRGGGWGVFFVRKFMDRLDYRYQDGRNQFIMEKRVFS